MASQPIPKKSLGQHWLHDEASLQAMCEAAELQNTDIVLEIGPGLGTLTKLLVNQAKAVVAVEFDINLARGLQDKVNSNKLEVVHQDILSFDLTTLPEGYKVVANIPYYLTSHLVRVLSETTSQPDIAALLVQKEVAERIAAKPGSMSLLSITAQYYWGVSLGRLVNAELFSPPPKVDSQIVILKRRSNELFEDIDAKKFFRLVKAGFSQRRKTLLNSLSAGLQMNKTTIMEICMSAQIDPKRRPQTLSMDEWRNLYLVYSI